MILGEKMGRAFVSITFFLLIFLILIASWTNNWIYSAEIVAIILFLCGYSLILTLPIKKFRLTPASFEGELDKLVKEKPKTTVEEIEEVQRQVEDFSEESAQPDTILIQLSIEIEKTLRKIGKSYGIQNLKKSMGYLTRNLQKKQIITDKWLINALDFFRVYRNELLHEGKRDNLLEAIDVGEEVLARLKQIEKKEKVGYT